jgi:hypothetical protein
MPVMKSININTDKVITIGCNGDKINSSEGMNLSKNDFKVG